MGKKKSVVLMVFISIVLFALTVFSVYPAHWFPWNDGLKGWNSVAADFVDFGSDYKGGYYVYYYPEGVISEAKYKDNYASLNEKEGVESEKQKEYRERFIQSGGLYLDKEADFITDGDQISEDFKEEMQVACDVIAQRFSQKHYTDYTVSVVDTYAIRVDIPNSVAKVNQGEASDDVAETLQLFANVGEMTLKLNGTVVDEMLEDEAKVSDFIKHFSLDSKFKYKFIRVKLTADGADLIERLEDEGSLVSQETDTTMDGNTGLWLYMGDTPVLPIYSENVASKSVLKCMYNEAQYKGALESRVILLNSGLDIDGCSFLFSDVTSEIREKSHVYGQESSGAMLILLGAATLLAIIVAAVVSKRFGGVFGYMACTYVSLTSLSFAFITKTLFVFTLGTALMYLFGLALMLALHFKTYSLIKDEVKLGKTVNSAVKLGYKKSVRTTVDVYAVLALGVLGFLVGIAGVTTMVWQALLCFAVAAFCNLVWGRAINSVALNTCKDKYKYFGLVREDDDDE